MSSPAPTPPNPTEIINRVSMLFSNIKRLLNDATFYFIDKVFFRGQLSNTKLGSVVTLMDVWKRLEIAHGESVMNVVYFTLLGVAALVLFKIVFDFYRVVSVSYSSKKRGEQLQNKKGNKSVKNNKFNSACNGHKEGTSPRDNEEISKPVNANVIQKNTKEIEDPDLLSCFSPAPPVASYLLGPSIDELVSMSSITSTTANKKKTSVGQTNFPRRIGVMELSPCQQYWLISCRKSYDARIYPQSHITGFMTKGKELAKACHTFCSLGGVVGAALGIPAVGEPTPLRKANKSGNGGDGEEKEVRNADIRPIDISTVAFLHSAPLGAASFASHSAAASIVSSASSSCNPEFEVLFDSSTAYCVVGESTKDAYIILQITKTNHPSSTNTSDAKAQQRSTIQATVLWLFKRPNHKLVWDHYRIGLYSSFSTHLDVPLSSSEEGRSHIKPRLHPSNDTVADMVVLVTVPCSASGDAVMEVYHRRHMDNGGVQGSLSSSIKSYQVFSKIDANSRNFHLNHSKFKVGHLTSVLLSDPFVFYSGSFLKEPRVTQMVLPRYPPPTLEENNPASAYNFYSIDKLYSIENNENRSPIALHGPIKNSGKAVVQAMTVIQSHWPVDRLSDCVASGLSYPSPFFLLVFYSDGNGAIYDVEAGQLPVMKVGDLNPYRKYFRAHDVHGEAVAAVHVTQNSNLVKRRPSPQDPIATFHDTAFASPSCGGGGCDGIVGVISRSDNNKTTSISTPLVWCLYSKLGRRISVFVTDFPSLSVPLFSSGNVAFSRGNGPAPITTTNEGDNNNKNDHQIEAVFCAAPACSFRDILPRYNQAGEENSIKGIHFVQNGKGLAVVGDQDGQGIVLHDLMKVIWE